MAKKPKNLSDRPLWERAASNYVAALRNRDITLEKCHAAFKRCEDAEKALDEVQRDSAWQYPEMTPQQRLSWDTVSTLFPSVEAAKTKESEMEKHEMRNVMQRTDVDADNGHQRQTQPKSTPRTTNREEVIAKT